MRHNPLSYSHMFTLCSYPIRAAPVKGPVRGDDYGA